MTILAEGPIYTNDGQGPVDIVGTNDGSVWTDRSQGTYAVLPAQSGSIIGIARADLTPVVIEPPTSAMLVYTVESPQMEGFDWDIMSLTPSGAWNYRIAGRLDLPSANVAHTVTVDLINDPDIFYLEGGAWNSTTFVLGLTAGYKTTLVCSMDAGSAGPMRVYDMYIEIGYSSSRLKINVDGTWVYCNNTTGATPQAPTW